MNEQMEFTNHESYICSDRRSFNFISGVRRLLASANAVTGHGSNNTGTTAQPDLLFTLKFDEVGNWKIIKTHEMSEKEVEGREKEQ